MLVISQTSFHWRISPITGFGHPSHPLGGAGDVAPRWMFFNRTFHHLCIILSRLYTSPFLRKPALTIINDIDRFKKNQIYYKGDFPDIYEFMIIYDQPHFFFGVKKNYPKSRSTALEAFEALGPFGFMTSTIIFSRAWPLRLGAF